MTTRRMGTFFLMLWMGAALAGCGGKPVAPVKGKVTFKGQPLDCGSVMFQPKQGRAARGVIKPDGTFTLSTFGTDDGALIGLHQVRVSCYEGQRAKSQGAGEPGLGKSLIPEAFANFASSGLTFEVKPGETNNPTFDLIEPPDEKDPRSFAPPGLFTP